MDLHLPLVRACNHVIWDGCMSKMPSECQLQNIKRDLFFFYLAAEGMRYCNRSSKLTFGMILPSPRQSAGLYGGTRNLCMNTNTKNSKQSQHDPYWNGWKFDLESHQRVKHDEKIYNKAKYIFAFLSDYIVSKNLQTNFYPAFWWAIQFIYFQTSRCRFFLLWQLQFDS